jgi:hypothetical protein
MRQIFSLLILLISVSFFTIACGEDTKTTDNTCSALNTNGTCEAGKVCQNGICVANTCTPSCANKVCGDNGCGGSCGSCNAGETCNAAGTCETSTCTPSCTGKVCGDDGCGGSCGSCNTDQYCSDAGACVTGTCTPSCAGKVCGTDGCGGSCGTCNANETCNAAGTCETNTCTPNCTGKVCGNDGCGGSCGSCNANETCNAAGTCDAAATDGALGGSCSQTIACVDTDAQCLSADGGVTNTCFQTCNGTGDTCRQNGFECVDAGTVGWICLEGSTGPGTTPIGGDCSTENCVAGATCLGDGTTSNCYEDCDTANDSCSTNGYTCQAISTGDLFCFQSTTGDAQPGEACSNEVACVATAMCLTTDNGVTNFCYEKCTGTTDTCSQANYACVDTGNASIGWVCMEGAGPGTTPIGGDCSTENCVDTAMCLNTGPGTPQICYENCTGATDTCTLNNYACVDTGVAGIDWICMEQAAPGTTPIGGDCSTENCVAGATCLGDGTTSNCYEDCDVNTGGTCSTPTYTCQAIASGDTFCFAPQK